MESFTTHKHLVLHAHRGSWWRPRLGRAEEQSHGRAARRAAAGIALCITTVLHSHPHPAALLSPSALPAPPSPSSALSSSTATCNHGAERASRNASRVTVHTQNRYVLINVWIWCCAEASLPSNQANCIAAIVLPRRRSFASPGRILFTARCTPRRTRDATEREREER